MSYNAGDLHEYLPLTSVVFEIMLALADGPLHGYAVMQEVERRSTGQTVLRTGTLYRAMNRMLRSGFIEETTDRAERVRDDARRRYYRLTRFGRRVAAAESERLASVVRVARTKKLLDQAST